MENRIYVSSRGCDTAAGTEKAPFATLLRAQEEARLHPGSTVLVQAGTYRTALTLGERDSKTVYRTEEGAVLTGGLTLPADAFSAVPDTDAHPRFGDEARPHIRVLDLQACGIHPDALDEVLPIGSYHTAARYDNAKTGENIEVFSGGRRMTVARYPKEGYLHLDAVMDCGEAGEFPAQNYWEDNRQKRNPRPGTYIIDPQTNERIKTWAAHDVQGRDPVWLFGYLCWDWADSSTPVTFNTRNRAIFPKYVSHYAARPGALYYLYNIPEELSAPGEYYLDRQNARLYVYPYQPEDDIEISLSTAPVFAGTGAQQVTIDGFTIKAVRGDAVHMACDACSFRNLTIRNVSGNGISLAGTENLVEGCDISHTGRGGISLSGGDRATLTPGHNTALNNYIHDFSEVYQTYQPGVALNGVGNCCAHNEICRAPHEAIAYGGNEHIIEYNNIHDIVLHSSDAGAIYAGFDWCGHGTVIRYNLLRNIGSTDFTPDGIYWDDGLSGQTAYGNILIGVRKFSFLIGGGFGNVVRDNLVISEAGSPLYYEDRNRDGFVHGGWSRQAVDSPDSKHWQNLRAIPYTEEPWRSRYPELSLLKTDLHGDPDDPYFPVNPARSIVENNLVVQPDAQVGYFAPSVLQYSRVENNRGFHTCAELGFDPDTLTFTKQPDGFPVLPVEKIGRFPQDAAT